MVRSYGFIVSLVRGKENSLLKKAGLDRLLATASPEEFYRALSESGYGEASNQAEVEAIAAGKLEDAAELFKRYSPEPEVTDCFLVEYDAHNLKMLFKARALELEAAPSVSGLGLMNPEVLRLAVRDGRYKRVDIPEFQEACERIEKQMSLGADPLYIDAQLDSAIFQYVARRMAKSRNAEMKRYFKERTDIANLLIVLRSRDMGRDASFAEQLFAEGGTLDKEAIIKLFNSNEGLGHAADDLGYARIIKEGLTARNDGRGLALLEKLGEDYLFGIVAAHRNESLTLFAVVYYYLATQREAQAVRLILSARLSGFGSEALAERLRDSYAS